MDTDGNLLWEIDKLLLENIKILDKTLLSNEEEHKLRENSKRTYELCRRIENEKSNCL